MTTDHTIRIPARLRVLAATAMLLERLEQLPRTASAAQYQGLVRQLDALLVAGEGDPSLVALLDSLPALAELHENHHYAVAGLSRTSMAAAARSKHLMLDLLDRARCRC